MASEQCPECGQSLATTDAVVTGQLRRRRGLIATGVVLLVSVVLLMVAGATQVLRNVNWYAYKPTAWVIADMRSKGDSVALKAYKELDRRISDGQLSAGQCESVAEAALAELTGPQPRPGLNNAHVKMLYALYTTSRLTAGQQTRFFDNLVEMQLRARPRSLISMGIPVDIITAGRTSHTPLWIRTYTSGATLAGVENKYVSDSCSFSGGGSSTDHDLVKTSKTGVNPVHAKVKFEVFDGSGLDPKKSTLLHKSERVLKGQSEVLADEPADFLQITTDPSLEPLLKPAFVLKKIATNPYSKDELEVDIGVHKPPVDLAFRITVLSDGREVASGTIGVPRGRITSWRANARGAVAGLTQVDVVFTPDPDLAKRSTNLFEIWGKPIRFENVMVEGQQASSTSPAPGGGPPGSP
jgi:hypothetical protein